MTTPLENMPPQRPNDRRGWLTFTAPLPEPYQSREDSTQENDFSQQHWLNHVRLRPATPTERELLQHLGYVLPAALKTRVEYLTATLRRRTWPQIEGQTP